MTDLRQAKEYAQYLKSLGFRAVYLENSLVSLRKLPLIGNVAKLQRPNKNPGTKGIQDFINEYKISIFYFEPLQNVVIPQGFTLSKSVFLPSKTLQIDLKKSEKALSEELKPKTRYNIKIARKNGIEIKESLDINLFANLWQSSALKRGQFLPQQKEIKSIFESFGKKAHLYLAYPPNVTYIDICNTKPLAGLLVLDSPDTAYYMYAFTTSEGRKLFAPTLLTWTAVLEAKKRKLKIFDFDGIYDVRYPKLNKNWKGFTKFKEGFGGQTQEFPQPLAYYKYSLIKWLGI